MRETLAKRTYLFRQFIDQCIHVIHISILSKKNESKKYETFITTKYQNCALPLVLVRRLPRYSRSLNFGVISDTM